MARRLRYNLNVDEEPSSHWISYSDLMSALLLMFALLLMLAILNQQKSIDEKNRVIEEVTGIKTSIIDELNREFQNSNLEMKVDPKTGAIRFSNEVFFEFDSAEISEEGKLNLQQFIPRYINVLLSQPFSENISQIIVEGHTDKEGSYLYNLDLSQNRSLSVVKEIFSEDFPVFPEKERLRSLMTANGRSFSEPIYNRDMVINEEKSRRVEFKFRLKDEEVIEKIHEIVN